MKMNLRFGKLDWIALVGLFVLLAGVGEGYGQTLFSDNNFGGAGAGNAPGAGAPGSWVLNVTTNTTTGGTGSILVSNTNPNAGAGTDTTSLNLLSNTNDGTTTAEAEFGITNAPTKTFQLSFDFYDPTVTGVNSELIVRPRYNTAAGGSFLIDNNNGALSIGSLTGLAVSDWYHVTLDFSQNGTAVVLHLEDMTTGTVVGSITYDQSQFSTLSYGYSEIFFTSTVGATGNMDAYISNVNVAFVPEPGTFCLVGMGLAMVAFRRRARLSLFV
jgi:hypothetical protein